MGYQWNNGSEEGPILGAKQNITQYFAHNGSINVIPHGNLSEIVKDSARSLAATTQLGSALELIRP